ncbi:MAG: PH domain-containing protein [Lachnospiraceae bacterium]|nr:PH domain-containing protein [Lachnospiraceae bacterium]
MAYTEKKRSMFFGLPWTFTTYHITEEVITVNSGFLRRTENDSYLYKIVDVRLETSLLERIFGLGTVHCFGGDVTDPDLILMHIKNAKEVKDFILHYSEDQRLKRRTLNTQNIGGGPELENMADHDPCMY